MDKLSEREIGFFINEKLSTVALLKIHKMISGNQTAQRQCQSSSVHASHFHQVCKASVAVLKLDYSNLIFIEPGAQINRQYYQHVLLMQELLPVMHSIAGDVLLFQQDSAPTHCALDMVDPFCFEIAIH